MQALGLLALLLASPTPVESPTPPIARREAISVTRPGLPNLFQVTEDLYRGGQPDVETGYAELRKLGIKTVVSLQTHRDDRAAAKKQKLDYLRIPVDDWRPSEDDIAAFLKIVTDADRTPVYVHCNRGSDRTGVMTAAYRMVVQGWEKEDAVAEMVTGPFGFHPAWKDLEAYVESLDVDALRRSAGLDVQ